MPELPEVETTRRGLLPHCRGQRITEVTLRERRLRWPVDPELPRLLRGQRIGDIQRRAKYLKLLLDSGTLLVHLGMSGSLRILTAPTPALKHDHLDFTLGNACILRFNDPRRFGSVQWFPEDCELTPLADLGPEPLTPQFDGAYLHRQSRGRRVAVKPFIMDARVVVGVGNIYATEALFRSGIRPDRQASRISAARYERLAEEIRQVLAAAIDQGGTTLRDFVGSDGRPGYFAQQLDVYGRAGEACRRCGAELREKRLGQRSSVFCAVCQR